jgi:hypothetical protein
MAAKRTAIPEATKRQVLIEAGYRCGVPTCRTILAIDLHHLVEVSEGGGNDGANLIALCPTCHALHHRGTIPREALYSWKGVLVALGAAFDREAIDRLLFLSMCPKDYLVVSGDGLLHYSRLIAAGLARVDMKANNAWQIVTYAINISGKGRLLIDAWRSGDRQLVADALASTGA